MRKLMLFVVIMVAMGIVQSCNNERAPDDSLISKEKIKKDSVVRKDSIAAVAKRKGA